MTLQAVTQVTNFKILTKSNVSSKRAKQAMSALSISSTTPKSESTDVKITQDAQARTSLAAIQRLEEGVTLGQKAHLLLQQDDASELQETLDRFDAIAGSSGNERDADEYLNEEGDAMKRRIGELQDDRDRPTNTPKDSADASTSANDISERIKAQIATSVSAQINKVPESIINSLM